MTGTWSSQPTSRRERAVNLATDHPLRSRASALIGHSNLLRAAFGEAEHAFADARATSMDDPDETEAIHGFTLARIIGEQADATSSVRELLRRRHESPTLLVRATTAELVRRRFNEGLAGVLPIEEARHALAQVEDPRVRTSFTYIVAYILGQRAEYERASEWLGLLQADVEEFDLEFARPHADWTAALAPARASADSEKPSGCFNRSRTQSLQVTSAAHRINARTLRARLLLQTGQADEAVRITSEPPAEQAYPSWRASIWRHARSPWRVGENEQRLSTPREQADATSRCC